MNELDIIGRVKIFINHIIVSGIADSQKAAGVLMGYSNESSFSQILTKKTPIPKNFISKLKIIEPTLNEAWIMTGSGDMLSSNKADRDIMNDAEDMPRNMEDRDYSLVPLYNMDAKGGFGVNDEVDIAEYIQDYIPFKNAKQGDICVPVTGKSMLPTYYPGSIILLHEIEYWSEFLEMGQVYVVILTDGRRLLKELRHSLESRKTHILCVSHNPDMQDSELPKSMIYKIFLVTALYQKTTM